MTETQERFLRAVLTRVPLDAVVELHLFPPIRRGTLETGVAVIAIEPPPVALAVVADDVDLDVDADTDFATDVEIDDAALVDAEISDAVGERDAVELVDAELSDTVDHESPYADEMSDAADSFDADGDGVVVADAETSAGMADASDAIAGSGAPESADDVVVESDVSTTPVAVPHRLRILTASYRSTIKGPDRGKWSFDVQEEADAPLEAVEAVLRGVRHRSTEPADPELVSHESLAALLAPVVVAPAA
jgi:hypothetical protein